MNSTRRVPRRTSRPSRVSLVALGAVLFFTASPGGLRAQDPDAAVDTAGPQPARLVGQIVSEVTGEPLVGATVALRRARRGALADSSGHFSIPEALAGEDTLEVRYVGYEPGFTPIDLEANVTTRVVLLLAPHVVRIAELEVQIERGEFRLGLREFERRRARGIGEFVTLEQIERQNPNRTSDVLRRVPGLRVGPSNSGGRPQITMGRDAIGCHPAIFVDGLHLAGSSVDDVTVPDLGAIEVYPAASQIPPKYATLAPGACGAILIWTRRGTRPGDGGP